MAKIDEGFKESEKLLNQLEKEVHEVYAQAKKEMGEKVDAYFAKFEKENAKMEQAVRQGRMSVKDYNDWRMRKMATGKQYIAMRNTLAKDLTNSDKIAMKIVNQSLPDVYALNMNYGTYSIEKDSGINTSFTLYNHAAVERLIKDNPQLLPSPKVDIPKDLRWNQQHIQSAITQGILQGKSIPKIAEELQRVTGMDENAAIRNARTAMTGAQNAGRLDSMKRAAARGIGVKKGWMATIDHVTRDSHVNLDGEVQELDRPFSNGLMYPGDSSGLPAEVYNCRCRLTHEYDKYKTDWSNPANRNTSKMGNMSYDEWKNKHKGKGSKQILPKGVVLPLNKDGNVISIELPISDKLTGDKRNRAEKRIEEAKELINNLTSEYDSYLITVSRGNLQQNKDAGHVDIAGNMVLSNTSKDTILHEFAHTLATSDRISVGMASEDEIAFMKDITKLFTHYKKDCDKDFKYRISSYSLTNKDEFMAEAFTQIKAKEIGVKLNDWYGNDYTYSEKVLELIKKYFKKR